MSWRFKMEQCFKGNKIFETSGFTLLEMMIVLAILALSTALITVQFSSSSRKQTTRELSYILQAALERERLYAITQGRVNDVTFNLSKNSKTISGSLVQYSIPDYIRIDIKTGRELVRVSNVAVIRFFPDGSSVGGEIQITDDKNVSAIVQVNWLTGLSSLLAQDL